MGSTAQIVINPSLYKSMASDPAKDLAPVTLVQHENNLMVVTPSLPVKTVKAFIDYAKANPGKVTFASPGNGSPAHLAGELMNEMAGLNMLHVPYKGSSAAVNDLLAGHVGMAIDNMPALLPQVKAGKLRALAVAGEARSSAAPDIPTIQEAGLPGFVVPAWKGLLAPKGTPRARDRQIKCCGGRGARDARRARTDDRARRRAGRHHARAVRRADQDRDRHLGEADQVDWHQDRLSARAVSNDANLFGHSERLERAARCGAEFCRDRVHSCGVGRSLPTMWLHSMR